MRLAEPQGAAWSNHAPLSGIGAPALLAIRGQRVVRLLDARLGKRQGQPVQAGRLVITHPGRTLIVVELPGATSLPETRLVPGHSPHLE